MKKVILLLSIMMASFQVSAQAPSETPAEPPIEGSAPNMPVIVLACEPKVASDSQYNLDIVREGNQLKMIIYIDVFGRKTSEFFDVEAINRRDSLYTTLRSVNSSPGTGVLLAVAKKGRMNLDGEPVFASVFRGGSEYGVYEMLCVKKAPPPPAPEKTPEKSPEPKSPPDSAPTEPAPAGPAEVKTAPDEKT